MLLSCLLASLSAFIFFFVMQFFVVFPPVDCSIYIHIFLSSIHVCISGCVYLFVCACVEVIFSFIVESVLYPCI